MIWRTEQQGFELENLCLKSTEMKPKKTQKKKQETSAKEIN